MSQLCLLGLFVFLAFKSICCFFRSQEDVVKIIALCNKYKVWGLSSDLNFVVKYLMVLLINRYPLFHMEGPLPLRAIRWLPMVVYASICPS